MIRARRAPLILVGLFAAAASLEIGLRLLRVLGVSLDEVVGVCPNVGASTPLNHRPNVGRAHQRLDSPEKYGRFSGMEYDEFYDERGIKLSALRPQDGEGVRVLFMGDSFIEGYDDATTVPQRAYEWITQRGGRDRPLIVLNAAYSSYSPVIYTAQAKRLLPELRPDFLVIDIDETDLYDDAVRYRGLLLRDADGKVVGVDRSLHLLSLAEGCARARESRLYLWRLTGTLYYSQRIAARERDARLSERLFDVATTAEERMPAELRAQMEYFGKTLDELFATLEEYVPADHILVIRHPHRWHLEKNENGHAAWNRLVGGLVGAAAARNGVTFFDAQDELEAEFGGQPQRYYWNGDMHFNFDGMRAYGELVGRELLRKMRAAR
jgi:lysophospholipase L1-like esterase